VNKRLSVAASATLAIGCAAALGMFVRNELVATAQDPTPIGAWFGIARPCPASATADSPDHAAFCQQVCGACPSVPGALPPEVPMMPTLLADGTVLADDAGEISRFHTTAHGKWAANSGSGVLQLSGKQRFDASFLWLQSNPPPAQPGSLSDLIGQLGGTCCFAGAVRPRFVTYFDAKDPDRMTGFIQPYFFPIVDENGLVRTNPASAADPVAGNHVPLTAVDPLGPLPACAPQNGCLGTYHFVIRRVKAF
jgi:hypothetical protein